MFGSEDKTDFVPHPFHYSSPYFRAALSLTGQMFMEGRGTATNKNLFIGAIPLFCVGVSLGKLETLLNLHHPKPPTLNYPPCSIIIWHAIQLKTDMSYSCALIGI